jgi:hypothetical protein
MSVITEKKKSISVNRILAAAKKLNPEEIQLLKIKLFGNDIITELKVFEKEMKKRKNTAKKSDDEIVKAVRKIRTKNAAK